MDDPDKTRLKKGVFGIISVTALGTVMMSPALGIYGNFGPMALTAGSATPFVFSFSSFYYTANGHLLCHDFERNTIVRQRLYMVVGDYKSVYRSLDWLAPVWILYNCGFPSAFIIWPVF